jgi:hypothetical protein
MNTSRHFQRLTATAAVAFAGLFATAHAHAGNVVVDVSGAQSINLQGEAGNTVWLVDIGANGVLTSLDWSIALNAFSPSSLSEMQVSFGSSTGLDMITFAPGAADAVSGAGSYAGSLSLAGLGAHAGADGLLRIEFSEGYKDFAAGVAEGQWVSGQLTFGVSAVPEPASAALALLGLGLGLGFGGLRLTRTGRATVTKK